MPWFQEFADVAFTWQDAREPRRTRCRARSSPSDSLPRTIPRMRLSNSRLRGLELSAPPCRLQPYDCGDLCARSDSCGDRRRGAARRRRRSRLPRPRAARRRRFRARPSPPSSRIWSCPTSAGRPTCSPRAPSSRPGSPGRSRGSVQGYAANVVATQTPAPGTRVVANGAPIVSLELSRNPSYKQEGVPENASPYKGQPDQAGREDAGAGSYDGFRDRNGRTGRRPGRQAGSEARSEAGREAEAEGRQRAEGSTAAAEARVRGRRRAQGTARRDCAARAREAARHVARVAQAAHAERREPLALPAQLDRHRRRLRLARRRRRTPRR